MRDPTGALAVWFTKPAGALIQVVLPVAGAMVHAHWLAGAARRELEARFPTDSLVIVLDLALMTGRDPAIRKVLLETSRQMKDRITCTTIVPPHDASAVYLASLKAAAALGAIAGVRIEIPRSLPVAMAKLCITYAGTV